MPTESPSNPAVLITGSSTGIGAACALELDRLGWRVFAGVQAEADGRRLAENASARLMPVRIDVTDEASIAEAAGIIRDAVGEKGLGGLVNNAGIGVPGPLEVVPMAMVRRQFDVNVIGPIAVTQAMLPLVRAARGRIVNIGSVSGRIAAPYLGLYAGSKFALEALTDSLRVEVRRWGISVSIVEPGSVATPIWEKSRAAADAMAEEAPPEALELYAADIARFREVTGKAGEAAMPVEKVVRVVVHALTARRPRTRYPVAADTRMAIAVFRFLPDRVRDWLIRRQFGLS
ncbi:MAG: SDR family NAD(P)-dependent oxidoreductase [Planctomycetia bacterium]|nr:SDR family NAD(P)-dependent oxidoreductase [Planctomycetia bacterium]